MQVELGQEVVRPGVARSGVGDCGVSLEQLTEQVHRMLGVVFEPEDWVELRLIGERREREEAPPTMCATVRRCDIDDRWMGRMLFRNDQRYHVYFGANPRRGESREAGRDGDVPLARCVFADFDRVDEGSVRLALEAAAKNHGLPEPTILLNSGHGVHAYWRLSEPITDLAVWTQWQKRLAGMLGSDACVHNPSRLMRLPGFLNWKEPVAEARLIECEVGRKFSISDFRFSIGESPAFNSIENRQSKIENRSVIDHHRNCTLTSIAGTMRRRGLAYEAIAAALLEHNAKACRPPLEKGDVEGIARSVCRYEPGDAALVTSNNPNYLGDGVGGRGDNSGNSSAGAMEMEGEGEVDEAKLLAGPAWPVVDERMYHGIAGRIVKCLEEHSEADPAGMLIQLLIACGSMMGSNPHTLIGRSRHGTNLFAVLVGDSSTGRKGTAWSDVSWVLKKVDRDFLHDHVVGGSSSGEGWIERVRDPLMATDDKDGSVRTVVEGVADKRLLVLESELARVLKNTHRETNILSPVIRQAWDDGNLYVMTRNNPLRATGAHISFIGHITRDELNRLLGDTDLFNGFANRMLWTCVKRSKLLPRSTSADEGQLCCLAGELSSAIRFAREQTNAIVRSDEAEALWDGMYRAFAKESKGAGLLAAVTNRKEAQVTRLALLYALLDESPVIEPEHLLAAKALWDYCQGSAAYVFGHTTGDKLADDLLLRLKMFPMGLTRTQIHDVLGRWRSAARINEALQRLASMGLAMSEKRPGVSRPATVWTHVAV